MSLGMKSPTEDWNSAVVKLGSSEGPSPVDAFRSTMKKKPTIAKRQCLISRSFMLFHSSKLKHAPAPKPINLHRLRAKDLSFTRHKRKLLWLVCSREGGTKPQIQQTSRPGPRQRRPRATSEMHATWAEGCSQAPSGSSPGHRAGRPESTC